MVCIVLSALSVCRAQALAQTHQLFCSTTVRFSLFATITLNLFYNLTIFNGHFYLVILSVGSLAIVYIFKLQAIQMTIKSI